MKKRVIETIVFGFGLVAMLGVSFVAAQPIAWATWEELEPRHFFKTKIEGAAVKEIELTDVTPVRFIVRSNFHAPLVGIIDPNGKPISNSVVRHVPIFASSNPQEKAMYQMIDFTPSRTGRYRIGAIFEPDCPVETLAMQITKIGSRRDSFKTPDGNTLKAPPTRQTMGQAREGPADVFRQDVAVSLPFRHAGQLTRCHGSGVLDKVPSFFWSVYFKADAGQVVTAEVSGGAEVILGTLGPHPDDQESRQGVVGNKNIAQFIANTDGYYSIALVVKSSVLQRSPVSYDLLITASQPELPPINRAPKFVPSRPR